MQQIEWEKEPVTNINVDPIALIQKHWGDVPVPVFEIVTGLGLGPDFEYLPDNISGAIKMRADGNYRIVVNANHHPNRQRFTAAHELGHYIYHRDLLGQGVGDTRAYRAEGTGMPNPAIRPMHERQANSFAANLLMPMNSIYGEIGRGITDTKMLADRFGVSEMAMKIRLGR
ncbi:ImmA/IrrE family metallo-endopeptidase [Brevundimonas sp. NPDC092305]|uniref:ImmA/IrrE family metallo-endopeptidase n=1 Tax=Brevundimonas sp. NPDC092305 TaxID=3363957 RepID=UPI0038011DF7